MEEHYHNMTSTGVTSRGTVGRGSPVPGARRGGVVEVRRRGGGGKAAELRARLQTSLDKAKDTCRKLEGHAVESAKAADRVIRRHPYESMGIAFGVGVLLGVLINRR